jgi:hypothetical protein
MIGRNIVFIVWLLGCLWPLALQSQITGKVTDAGGMPLPFVNIYLQDSFIGTTTNDAGNYELNISEAGTYTILFQFLGYETRTVTVSPQDFPFQLDATLLEASVSLDEVVISSSEDPAYRILRETIARRKEHLEKISAYTAQFYSRGIWRVDDMPEKILGQEVGDFDGALDSTRTGIIYLSETISDIAFQQPDEFKETIRASKVSGNDNGFSFNSARDANFSFYENTVNLNAPIVSPIADNAMNYYRYSLEGVFYEGNKLINKISVQPKRPNDRVWQGTIYIVEDDWQLYGVALETNGQAIQVPMVSKLVFKQNFKYDRETDYWIKISQTIDFGFSFFGFEGDGRFIAVYSEYDFSPAFSAAYFTNEVLSFQPEANKKDSLFWQEERPVPLTVEERDDYLRKDSIQELRKSKSYLDSIDRKDNRIGALDLLLGYTYRNSFRNWRLSYDGPLPGVYFNTVQGWNATAGLTFLKDYDALQTQWLYANLQAQYGFSDERMRFTGSLVRRFNAKNRLQLGVSAGNSVRQFNRNEPISPLVNTVSTLFFERNFMKVYELSFVQAQYSQELFNGLRIATQLGFEKRSPLFNTTDYVVLPNDDVQYTSNNPLDPNFSETAAIEKHELFRSQITANITFGQKYMSYPDGKFNLGNTKYPALTIALENGFGGSERRLGFAHLRAEANQTVPMGNKGDSRYSIRGGTFFNAEGISFVDYQHFNGNQTRVGTSPNYTNTFNLLPYYNLSTNQSYFEGHLEHDFRGWVLGKVPGMNQLNFNLVIGAHLLSTSEKKPYSEVSVGIDNVGVGKYRLLRIDYVKSFYDGDSTGAFIFGLKFLGLLE